MFFGLFKKNLTSLRKLKTRKEEPYAFNVHTAVAFNGWLYAFDGYTLVGFKCSLPNGAAIPLKQAETDYHILKNTDKCTVSDKKVYGNNVRTTQFENANGETVTYNSSKYGSNKTQYLALEQAIKEATGALKLAVMSSKELKKWPKFADPASGLEALRHVSISKEAMVATDGFILRFEKDKSVPKLFEQYSKAYPKAVAPDFNKDLKLAASSIKKLGASKYSIIYTVENNKEPNNTIKGTGFLSDSHIVFNPKITRANFPDWQAVIPDTKEATYKFYMVAKEIKRLAIQAIEESVYRVTRRAKYPVVFFEGDSAYFETENGRVTYSTEVDFNTLLEPFACDARKLYTIAQTFDSNDTLTFEIQKSTVAAVISGCCLLMPVSPN